MMRNGDIDVATLMLYRICKKFIEFSGIQGIRFIQNLREVKLISLYNNPEDFVWDKIINQSSSWKDCLNLLQDRGIYVDRDYRSIIIGLKTDYMLNSVAGGHFRHLSTRISSEVRKLRNFLESDNQQDPLESIDLSLIL